MKKKSFIAQMSTPVSQDELNQANQTIAAFEKCLSNLKIAKNHLDIMYTPFKDHPDIENKEIMKFRSAIRRFRDKSLDNFNAFKLSAVKAISLMNFFSSDTEINNLLNSFTNAVGELEEVVNDFFALFNKLESKDLVSKIVQVIEGIQSKCDEIEEIINDRIIGDLKTDILGKTWIDSITDNTSLSIEKRKPIMLDILNKKDEGKGNKV